MKGTIMDFINGYLIQELSDNDYKKFEKLVEYNSTKIMIICKCRLKNCFSELNVLENTFQKIIDVLAEKNIKYLFNKKDYSIEIYLYSNLCCYSQIIITEENSIDTYIRDNYKKIVFTGYQELFDSSLERALNL